MHFEYRFEKSVVWDGQKSAESILQGLNNVTKVQAESINSAVWYEGMRRVREKDLTLSSEPPLLARPAKCTANENVLLPSDV